MPKDDVIELVEKIAASRKYRSLYPKTIERVVNDCLLKYDKNEVEKRARNLLHQIWGAYYGRRPNFKKLLEHFEDDIKSGRSVEESVLPILCLQSSTKERIPILDDFYSRIFSITGTPKLIIDSACGLNPLTFFWMKLPEDSKYIGFDIDKDQVVFLTSIFKFLGNKQVSLGLGDVLVDNFIPADVVFMLKLLPSLEQQKKGAGLKVIEEQRCRYLVVSYPIRSLSGKQKGMADFYTNQFYGLIKTKPWRVEKLMFATELVLVIEK